MVRPPGIMLDNKTKRQLDETVYTLISSGKANRANTILAFIVLDKNQSPIDERVLDKSLQRLRKGKHISFDAKAGWKITDHPFPKPSAAERTVPLPFPEPHQDDPENRDG